jgi:DnaJ family protein B protein 4
MPIDLVESLCGCDLEITTIDRKKINFSSYGPIAPDREERFPGLGMPDVKDPNKRGDMIVHFKVDYPKTLTETQRTTLREIFSENAVLRE